MIYNLFPTILFVLFSFFSIKTSVPESDDVNTVVYAKTVESTVEAKIEAAYKNLHSDKFTLPKSESFTEALKGYYSLK